MLKAIRTINSKNKKSIRFVAAGSFQIEFFEVLGDEYFTIYRFHSGSQYSLAKLNGSVVSCISDNEFQILEGISTYKVRVKNAQGKSLVHVTRYLWGWLPLNRYGGEVSSAGLSTLKSNLLAYVYDPEIK